MYAMWRDWNRRCSVSRSRGTSGRRARHGHVLDGPAADGAPVYIAAGEFAQVVGPRLWRRRRDSRDGRDRARCEETTSSREERLDVSGGIEAAVADLFESVGQDVQKETPEKLDPGKRDGLSVLRTESNGRRSPIDDPTIGNADAVRVPAEIGEDVLVSAKWLFCVDDPARVCEARHEPTKGLGISEAWIGVELATSSHGAEGVEHFAANYGAHHFNREEVFQARHPRARIEGEAARGNERMEVRVECELAGPGVQDHGDPEGRTEAALSELEQRLARRCEERVVNEPGGVPREGAKLRREREDDVEVADRQEPRGARTNPPLLREALAFGAMPIATGVVRRMLVPARAAHVDMAAECGRPAERDRREHPPFSRGERMLGLELGAVRAHDVGDVEARPPGEDRGLCHAESARVHQPFEGALGLRERPGADARIDGRRPNVGMAEQDLNCAQVRPALEEVGGEAVPE